MNEERTWLAETGLEDQPLTITAAHRRWLFFVLILIALGLGVILFFGRRWSGDIFAHAGVVALMLSIARRPSSVWNPGPYAVTIDGVGIHSHDHKRSQPSLAWAEMTAIKDCPHARRLEVHGPPGAPPLPLVYELQHFAKLTRFLLEELPHERFSQSFPITFQTQLSFHSLLPLLSCFLIIVSWPVDYLDWLGAIFATLAVFVGLLLVAFQLSLRSLEVHPTILRIHKGWTVREIPYQEIEAVNFILPRDPLYLAEQTRPFDVKVKLTTNREMSILPEGCDALAVYQAAKHAWEAATKRGLRGTLWESKGSYDE